jgi:GntR family transcriptional regulator
LYKLVNPMPRPGLSRYHRIFLSLREQILDGSLRPGQRLPGEHELAAQHGVSRITTRRALDELQLAGLVTRSAGRGSFVRADSIEAATLDGTLESLETSNRMIGRSKVRVLGFSQTLPPPAARATLQLSAGEEAICIERLRVSQGTPFCHVTAYVPLAIGRSFAREDVADTMLVELIERAGIRIDRAEQSVSATLANNEVAALLEIEEGAPLLRVTRTAFSVDDTPCEHFVALFRPDRYRIIMEMSRRERSSEDGGPADIFQITA